MTVPSLILTVRMEFFVIFLVLCMAMLDFSSRINAQSSPPHLPFNVLNYGAIGDGKTDDSQAFLKAWKAVCGATSKNPILIIPSNKKFLLNPVLFSGPCKSSSVNVQVWGNIVAPINISAWTNKYETKWIGFSGVKGLNVNGNGVIDGQGFAWWKSCQNLGKNCVKPTALEFHCCDNLKLSGLKHMNSQRNHISISNCNGATISGLNITAPGTSPNTDGIDISNSNNIMIRDCNIATGDDCIAIDGGCSYINITGVTCGPGHGISVGSLGVHGARSEVEEVHVKNCTFMGTTNGARIKTWQGGSGYARKISFQDINLIAADNPIIIDQFYCDHLLCKNETSAVKISDILYRNFSGTSMKEDAINLKCSESCGCINLVLDKINITSVDPKKGTHSSCLNAHGRCTSTFPAVNCLL